MKRIMNWTPQMKKGGLLFGAPGRGKSALGKALINHWSTEEYRALFITIGAALDNIRNAIDDQRTTQAIEMDNLLKPGLLFIDDFGTEKISEFAEEKTFTVIDHRMRFGKHTWYSTNLTPEEIRKRYSARIFDRLMAACTWVKCEGPSYRQKDMKNEI